MRIKTILLIILSFLNVAVSSGQKNNKNVVIMGVISDTLQRPLVGALILIDGKSTNDFTNNDGVFRVKVRSDADSITIIAGKQMRTVPIMGRTRIDFVFNVIEPALSMQNINSNRENDKQVDIGYGTIDQKDLLSPVSTIDGRGNKYAAYKDIYELLKGTPGVIVRGNSIQINGPTSITSSNEPLFVVDGMSVESIDGINPIMVESISVLKGSSASIYGSRGANGVILITLFNGQK